MMTQNHIPIPNEKSCKMYENLNFLQKKCSDGRRPKGTAVAEDFRPTATATVAEVLGNSYGHRKFLNYSRVWNRRRAGNNRRAWKICQKQ